jgi:putative restriction endonuclease
LFFREGNFIPVPASWSPNIVSLKTYNTDDADGAALWNAVTRGMEETSSDPVVDAPRYGEPQLVKPRLGQGAFRAVVTDTYGRKCAITQERTLPALEAAHIRPYSEGGPHETTNGLLLRRDIHSLFDSGYVTVSSDLRFEVSRRIKEEFENGKHYYELHGQRIFVPEDLGLRPDPAALSWHREFCFKG